MNSSENYEITMRYVDSKNHEIDEKWWCNTVEKMESILCETLDLMKDKKGHPIEPDIEILRKNFEKYADEKFIKGEYNRMKKSFNVYNEIIHRVISGEVGFTVKYDRYTSYTID